MPGLGEEYRVTRAIDAWKESLGNSQLLIAGQNPQEDRHERLDRARLQQEPYNLPTYPHLTVHLQSIAEHTKGQTEWIAELVSILGIGSLALFTSSYHLLRAYLTLLKSLLNRGIIIPLIPVWKRVDLATISPATGREIHELIPGEIRRVLEYMAKGDVATPDEYWNYQSMLRGKQ